MNSKSFIAVVFAVLFSISFASARYNYGSLSGYYNIYWDNAAYLGLQTGSGSNVLVNIPLNETSFLSKQFGTGALSFPIKLQNIEYPDPFQTCENWLVSPTQDLSFNQSTFSLSEKKLIANNLFSNTDELNFKFYLQQNVSEIVTHNSPFWTSNLSKTKNGTVDNGFWTDNITNTNVSSLAYVPFNPLDFAFIANQNYNIKFCGQGLKWGKQYYVAPIVNGFEHSELTYWNTSWLNYTAYTLTSVGVAASQTNYPAYVEFNSTQLIQASKMNATCSDIRMIDEDNTTILNYSIYYNSCNTSNTVVKFDVPFFNKSTQNKTVYMYYNNPAALDAQNHKAVYQFAGQGGYQEVYWLTGNDTNSLIDEMGNTDATNGSGNTALNTSACKWANSCRYFSGTVSLSIPTNVFTNFSQTAWVWPDSTATPSAYGMAPIFDGGSRQVGLYFREGGTQVNMQSITEDTPGVWSQAVGHVTHYAYTYNKTIAAAYLNGTIIGNFSSTSTPGNGGGTAQISGASTTAHRWQGTIQEARISLATKDGDWISLEATQNFTAGIEQAPPVINAPPQFASQVFAPISPQGFYYNRTYFANITVTDDVAVSSVKAQWTSGNGTFMNISAINQSSVYMVNITSLTPGTWSVIWIANDSANLQNQSNNYTFTINANNGTVFLTYPASGSVNGTLQRFDFVPTFGAGISNCSLYDNSSGFFVRNITASNFSNATATTINKTFQASGSYLVGVICFDQNSVANASANITVTVYIGAPSISSIVASPSSPWTRDSSQLTMFNATINDTIAGISTAFIEFDFANSSTLNFTSAARANNVFNWNFTGLPIALSGSLLYRWIAVNSFGTQAVSASQAYYVNPLIIPIRATLGASKLTYSCNTTQAGQLLPVDHQNATFGFFNITNNASYNLDIRLSFNASLLNLTVYANSTLNASLALISNITSANATVVKNLTVGSSAMVWEYVNCSLTSIANQSVKHQFIFRKAGT